MNGVVTVLTERGQVSLPSVIRRQLKLRPGQPLRWSRVSDHEIRVMVPGRESGRSMRGWMRRYLPAGPVRTADWLKILREGESA